MDHNNRSTHNSRIHGGGREDCWTESATETLIEAWGDRYLQLNRGNLRQKDWQEVAAAVNANRDDFRPPRTDAQCKNRIDTLKKKYKLEKSKPAPSKWPLFHRIEHLIGTANGITKKKLTSPKSTVKSKPKPDFIPSPDVKAIASSGGSSSNDDSFSTDCSEGTTAYKQLAMAILRFGEVYEKIENSKQEQMMELEKQRLEFAKELEFGRLNMFLQTQLEIEKMKKKTTTKTEKSTFANVAPPDPANETKKKSPQINLSNSVMIDNHGFLLGKFSALDDDMRIRD